MNHYEKVYSSIPGYIKDPLTVGDIKTIQNCVQSMQDWRQNRNIAIRKASKFFMGLGVSIMVMALIEVNGLAEILAHDSLLRACTSLGILMFMAGLFTYMEASEYDSIPKKYGHLRVEVDGIVYVDSGYGLDAVGKSLTEGWVDDAGPFKGLHNELIQSIHAQNRQPLSFEISMIENAFSEVLNKDAA